MVVDDGADAEERAEGAERAEHASVRNERPPTAGGSLSPRSARMSLALKSSRSGHSEAFSPAFLSPRMWNEEDMLLPPSSEVPMRPVMTGRDAQDKGCFGLYTFVMVLFLFQGTAAIFGANYQMPHEFALCRYRLQQETVKTARDIPDAEIKQHDIEEGVNAEERASPRHAHILMDISGHQLPLHLLPGAKHTHLPPLPPSLHEASRRSAGAARRLLTTGAGGEGAVQNAGVMAVGAAVEAAARDEESLDKEVASDIKPVISAVHSVVNAVELEREANASLPAAGEPMGGGGINGSAVTALQTADRGKEGNTSAAGGRGGDISVPDPFADGEEAEEALVTTYRRVGNASSIVALLAVSSIVVGAVWVMLLGRFTTVFVYATLFSLPMAFFMSAVCLLISGVNVWVPAALAGAGVLSCVIIYIVKERVSVTAALLTCSSKALVQNFSVFVVAIVLSLVQVIWLFLCFLFIGLSFMSGEAVRVWVQDMPGDEPQERCVWQTDGWAYVGMFFVILVMLWTNSIINEVKRYSVCGAIGLWYYGEVPKSQNRSGTSPAGAGTSSASPTLTALTWALRTSFGSVCFAALVASTCETLKVLFRPSNYESATPGRRKKERAAGWRESVWFCLEDVIGFVNRFATPMMAISGYGKSICLSANVPLLIPHRNNAPVTPLFVCVCVFVCNVCDQVPVLPLGQSDIAADSSQQPRRHH